MSLINTKLLLRLLNIQEFFAHQWLMSYPNDQQMLADLMKIRKQQVSITQFGLGSSGHADTSWCDDGGGSGGRGTIKGLRAKNDPNINPVIKHKKLSR